MTSPKSTGFGDATTSASGAVALPVQRPHGWLPLSHALDGLALLSEMWMVQLIGSIDCTVGANDAVKCAFTGMYWLVHTPSLFCMHRSLIVNGVAGTPWRTNSGHAEPMFETMSVWPGPADASVTRLDDTVLIGVFGN